MGCKAPTSRTPAQWQLLPPPTYPSLGAHKSQLGPFCHLPFILSPHFSFSSSLHGLLYCSLFQAPRPVLLLFLICSSVFGSYCLQRGLRQLKVLRALR